MTDTEWRHILETLRDLSDINAAALAATRLHKEASVEDLPGLMGLLGDEDAYVREAAAWPISELAGPSALPDLLLAYQRGFEEGFDNDGFTTALLELVQAEPDTVRKVLQSLSKSDVVALRENATWLQGFCKSSDP